MPDLLRSTLVALALAALPARLARADDAAPPAVVSTAPALDATSFATWQSFILPDERERRWRDVAWRPSMWEAVVEAQGARKPVLLWAMNGHPMGCT